MLAQLILVSKAAASAFLSNHLFDSIHVTLFGAILQQDCSISLAVSSVPSPMTHVWCRHVLMDRVAPFLSTVGQSLMVHVQASSVSTASASITAFLCAQTKLGTCSTTNVVVSSAPRKLVVALPYLEQVDAMMATPAHMTTVIHSQPSVFTRQLTAHLFSQDLSQQLDRAEKLPAHAREVAAM
jgi:hypothetical protein